MSNFKLTYSHNIIEHLGLKLYQNKPTNVMAELVSNSWDADAENVWIHIKDDHITVCDDGHGMSPDIVQNNYLVISKPKRTKDNIDECSPNGRKFMGRKGIGKLAPFGIAKRISVITVYKDNEDQESKLCWFVMDLDTLLEKSEEQIDFGSPILYEPETRYNNIPLDQVEESKNQEIWDFLNNKINQKGSGTLILMDKLSLRKSISESLLHQSIGRRFTVTLLRPDFSVYINNTKTDAGNALPKFDYRIPEEGITTDTINVNGIDREIRYWAGFVESAQWPQDQAGVGIYAHGKIAQDRPFFFGLKGREIYTRYMYAVIEGDWLDELPEDVVSTDRTSINWENEDTEKLYNYGHKLISKWINDYKKRAATNEREKLLDNIRDNKSIPKLTQIEQEQIVEVVSGLGPQVIKNRELQNNISFELASAMTHQTTRKLIKELWDTIDTNIDSDSKFLETLKKLNSYLVPEALSLSVATAQRIYAINKLYQLKINGNEPQLQKLIEGFPWLLSPDMAKLTANQKLKTVIEEASKKDLIPAHGEVGKAVKKDADLKPDFIFFSNADEKEIRVVELKSPQIELANKHRAQLVAYIDYLETHYPDAKVDGVLIGKNPNNQFKSPDTRVSVKTWESIFLSSRREYTEFLAAMLHGAEEYHNDSRVKDVMDFGGKETIELLKRMAEVNPELKKLMDDLEKEIHG